MPINSQPTTAKTTTPAKTKQTPAKKTKRASVAPDEAKIKLLVKENPHRVGIHDHKSFKKLRSGMTVAWRWKQALIALMCGT